MSRAPVGGTAYVKVDGVQLQLRGNLTTNIGDKERETVVGQDGVHGFTEKPMAPFIECEITDHRDLDIPALGEITDATVTAEMATGKVYVLRNAWSLKAPDLNAAEGSMTIRFEGLRGEEVR